MKTNKQYEQMEFEFSKKMKRKPKSNNEKKKLIKQIRDEETKTQLELPYEF
jgi:hypothetical protein